MNVKDKIFVAGGTGLAGKAIVDSLVGTGYTNIVVSYHSSKPIDSDVVKYVKLDLPLPVVAGTKI